MIKNWKGFCMIINVQKIWTMIIKISNISRDWLHFNADSFKESSHLGVSGYVWPPGHLCKDGNQPPQNPSFSLDCDTWARFCGGSIPFFLKELCGKQIFPCDSFMFDGWTYANCCFATLGQRLPSGSGKIKKTSHHIRHDCNARTSA